MTFRDSGFVSSRGLLFAVLVATGCAERLADVGSSGRSGMDATTNTPPFYAALPPPPQNDPAETGASTPYRLVRNDGEVLAVTVASGQLFWIGGFRTGKTITFPDRLFLRTCSPLACASTLKSWELTTPGAAPDSEGLLIPNWMWANDAWVFWPSEKGTSFCPHADCSSRRLLVLQDDRFADPSRERFAADDRQAFFDGAYACDLDDCTNTGRPLAPTNADGALGLGGSLSTVLDGAYLYAINNQRIVRFRKDGTGELEVIAQNQVDVLRIAVHAGFVYWTESVPLGRLERCPTTGCAGDPQVLATGLRVPLDLAVDDRSVYFTELPPDDTSRAPGPTSAFEQLYKKTISRCEIMAGIGPTPLVSGELVQTAPFIDENFVYFVGVECEHGADVASSKLTDDCSTYIGAVAK